MKACVDPGHGGADPGAVGTTPFRLEEKVVNLDTALLLEGELESRGHWVVMTRRQDRSVGLEARASFANRLAAELFVSVHANAAAVVSVQGMEVFHFPGTAESGRYGDAVLRSMLAAFPGHVDRV